MAYRPSRPGPAFPALGDHVVLRAALYYLALLAAALLLWQAWPRLVQVVPLLDEGGGAPAAGTLSGSPFATAPAATAPAAGAGAPRGTLAATVLLAMSAAVLLSLPVAWVYRLTRSKRGFQQSVVQTLVILPMVVAGVVVLVKDSLALAFGLAGIVAAVRFRTSLDDSKDAMYVFLATGIGLAAAVDLPVAAVLSIVFNAVILLLWYTDFGRQPAALEGAVAERRLNAALEHPTRTGTFVARVERDVLDDMSAEQLQLLAERAAARARRNDPDLQGVADARPELRLRLHATDPERSRRQVGQVLDQYARRWREGDSREQPDGTQLVEYFVTLRKRVEPEDMLEGVRMAAGLGANEVELR